MKPSNNPSSSVCSSNIFITHYTIIELPSCCLGKLWCRPFAWSMARTEVASSPNKNFCQLAFKTLDVLQVVKFTKGSFQWRTGNLQWEERKLTILTSDTTGYKKMYNPIRKIGSLRPTTIVPSTFGDQICVRCLLIRGLLVLKSKLLEVGNWDVFQKIWLDSD